MKIYGNEPALERLGQYRRSGKMPHSLLFCGDVGTGKKTLADYTAAMYFCREEDPPCGRCSECRRIYEHIHPDVIYADCGEMSVAELRELLRSSYSMPVEGLMRVYILREFSLANRECQNALLTYLEEPSDRVRFILTASDKNAVLPTILSRTATISTRPLSVEECTEFLKEHGCKEEPRRLAEMFGGNAGLALKAFEDKKGTLYLDCAREYVSAILEYHEYKALAVIQRLPRPKDDKRGPVKDLIIAAGNIIHDAFVTAGGGKASCGCDRELSEKLAEKYSLSVLDAMCEEVRRFSGIVSTVNFNPVLTANAFTAAIFSAAEKELALNMQKSNQKGKIRL